MKLSRLVGLFSIVAVLLGLTVVAAGASSHREAPLISKDPTADNTDVYMFRSPERPDSITFIANWIPFEDPHGGPNFYFFDDSARYLVNIDNDGDAQPDIVYEWRFQTHRRNSGTFLYNTGPVNSLDDPNLNMFQRYTLTRIDYLKDKDNAGNRKSTSTVLGSDLRTAPSNVGKASMPNYPALSDAATYNLNGTKAWAGQADDPFFLDLRVFDLLYGANLKEAGVDTLAGYNVHAVAIQVPIAQLTATGQPPASADDPTAVIGMWSTTERQTTNGKWVQVSRLGMPLVNEVVIDLARKDAFNAIPPTMDAVALDRVTDPEVPKLLKLIYNIDSPPAPRNDLVTVFLTGIPGLNQPQGVRPAEMMRLNMMTPVNTKPDRMGILANDAQGYPNGRRLGDDVIDISLQVVAGATPFTPAFNKAPNNTLGDGVNQNDVPFLNAFPYLGYAHPGSR
jgi:Domain of unknown function (DUF4331)